MCTVCLSEKENVNNLTYYLYNGKCIDTCPSFTVPSKELGKCIYPCLNSDPSCDVCEESTCFICANRAHFIISNFCFEACPFGTITNTTTKNCDCDPTCSQCHWENSTKLVICDKCNNATLYLKKHKCVSICDDQFIMEDQQSCNDLCDKEKFVMFFSSDKSIKIVKNSL